MACRRHPSLEGHRWKKRHLAYRGKGGDGPLPHIAGLEGRADQVGDERQDPRVARWLEAHGPSRWWNRWIEAQMMRPSKCESRVEGVLRAAGLERTSRSFLLRTGANLAWFHVQRWHGAPRITGDLAVWSATLARFHDPSAHPNAPRDWREAHWKLRLGEAMPGGEDFWWDDPDGLAEVCDDFCSAVARYGIPTLKAMSADHALLQYWREPRPFITTWERSLNVALLAHALNETDARELLEIAGREALDAGQRSTFERLERYIANAER